jgi:hypothetical protein
MARSAFSVAGQFELDALGGGRIQEKRAFPLGTLVHRGRSGHGRMQHGLGHIVDPEADVMQAWPVLGEPGSQRMIGGERLYQLQLGVAEVQVRQPDGSVVDLFGVENRETEAVAPQRQCRFGVGHGNGNVIQALEPGDGPDRWFR